MDRKLIEMKPVEIARQDFETEEGEGIRIYSKMQASLFGLPLRSVLICVAFLLMALGITLAVILSTSSSKFPAPPSTEGVEFIQKNSSSQHDESVEASLPVPNTTNTTNPPADLPPLPVVIYKYLDYASIVDRLHSLKAEFGDLVDIYTTQQKYGLSSAGKCYINGPDKDCDVWVIRITNKLKFTQNTPQVFFSGTLHGNERVGPTTVVEFATLLLRSYSRDAWAKRLIDTRAITIMPAANALGYSQNVREENGVDPNRDFAWDQQASSCMKTIAARSINEVWLDHIFQLSITFHGGDHLIAYPWGDTIHCQGNWYSCSGGWQAPDETGMNDLTVGLRKFVGKFASGRGVVEEYNTGALNDPRVIYPVNGGMEDWAYGASWDNEGLVKCSPSSFDGYSAAKTTYNNATNRAINLLVETAFEKTPSESLLGSSEEVLVGGGGKGNGHVARNIRLCWFLADMVQPWLEIVKVDELPNLVTPGFKFSVTWEAGGAISITEAKIVCSSSASSENLCSSTTITNRKLWEDGKKLPSIKSQVQLLASAPAGAVSLYIMAKFDQEWASPSRNEASKGQPQTHFVRARTDASWLAINEKGDGKSVVTGRVWWSSNRITFNVKSRRRAI